MTLQLLMRNLPKRIRNTTIHVEERVFVDGDTYPRQEPSGPRRRMMMTKASGSTLPCTILDTDRWYLRWETMLYLKVHVEDCPNWNCGGFQCPSPAWTVTEDEAIGKLRKHFGGNKW